MIFNGQELVLEAGTGDDAIGLDAIECVMTGEPMERIAFNPGYLLEGLAAIAQAGDQLGLHGPNKPAVLTGAAEFRRRRLRRLPVPADARPPALLACTSPTWAWSTSGPTRAVELALAPG